MRFARQPTKEEWSELEQMSQQAIGRVALRAQLIQQSARGYRVPELVQLYQSSAVTIYKWLDRFDQEGPAGLYDRARQGRPLKVDETTRQVIKETMSQPPTEAGYNFTYWTIPLLAQHLKETLGKQLCHETIRQHLHALDFRWRRPRWAVKRHDPHTATRMWAICQAILKAVADSIILIEDETILKTLPPLRQMWMPVGQQVQVPTPFQNENLCLYGALEFNTGTYCYQFYDTGNSDHTISYLEHLLATYPDQPILLIWDHARYHTSQAVQLWLEAHPRLTVMLLPKYAPKLNPVEHIWRQLKDRVAANLTRSLSALQQACERFFQEHSPLDLLRMAGLLLP